MFRMYEKRKAAALEIEKMVKDFVSVGNTSQIKKLLKVPTITTTRTKTVQGFIIIIITIIIVTAIIIIIVMITIDDIIIIASLGTPAK